MKNIAVTGGAGFIGSNISYELLNLGYNVTIIDDLTSGYKKNIEELKCINFYEANICNKDLMFKYLENIDGVIHLAASVGNKKSIDNPKLDAEINLMGTLNILESCKYNNVKKIVYSSSAGIYGELKKIPINENHPINPNTPYGVSKLAGEKMCLAYSNLYDINAVCLRYFNVYGVNQRYDQYGNVIPIFLHNAIHKMPLTVYGDGCQTRDFVNVKDVVQANIKSLESKNFSGSLNIASGAKISINYLLKKLKYYLNIDINTNYAPKRAGDVMNSLANISMAKKEIGYEPKINFNEGLEEYINWCLNNL